MTYNEKTWVIILLGVAVVGGILVGGRLERVDARKKAAAAVTNSQPVVHDIVEPGPIQLAELERKWVAGEDPEHQAMLDRIWGYHFERGQLVRKGEHLSLSNMVALTAQAAAGVMSNLTRLEAKVVALEAGVEALKNRPLWPYYDPMPMLPLPQSWPPTNWIQLPGGGWGIPNQAFTNGMFGGWMVPNYYGTSSVTITTNLLYTRPWTNRELIEIPLGGSQ